MSQYRRHEIHLILLRFRFYYSRLSGVQVSRALSLSPLILAGCTLKEHEFDFLSALIGALVPVFFSLIVFLLNRQHADRIQRNQLAVQLAIEKVKQEQENQRIHAKHNLENSKPSITYPPYLEQTTAEMLQFSEALDQARRATRWQRIRDKLGVCWSVVMS